MPSGRALRRPMVGLSLCVVAGIGWGISGVTPVQYAFLLALLLVILGCFMRNTRWGSVLLFGAIIALSLTGYSVSERGYSTLTLDDSILLPSSGEEVVGRVEGDPYYYPFKNNSLGMWVFPVQLEGRWVDGRWVVCRDELDVRVMGAIRNVPSARNGQRVWLKGELQKPYREGARTRLKAYSPACCIRISSKRFSLMKVFGEWRGAAAERLEVGIQCHEDELTVLRALVLGYRREIPSGIYARFRRTGLLHIFAISGLHVGMIGILLAVALKSLGVPRGRFGLILIPVLFIYVAATGMKESALRALIMAAVFLLAPLFRCKPDVSSSVAFAALLLLLINPFAIESIGFIFSFGIVAFIVMVYSKIPNHWLPRNRIGYYFVTLIITSLAASLASFPLTAYFFGRCSPIALVGNLLVVPLTFCTLLSGWLSILIPPASFAFNHASLVFIDIMLNGMRVLDQIPGSSFEVGKPAFGAVLLWCASLAYLLTHASTKRHYAVGWCGGAVAALWVVWGCCAV